MSKKALTNIKFYPIRIGHRDQLWDLAIRSKMHWKYPSDFMEKAKDALKLSALQIGQGWGEIATNGEQWFGYYFILPQPTECQLEHLWIEPQFIGQAVGTKLLEQAVKSVKDAGFHDTLRVYADPNSEGFYLKQGFKKVGEVPSEIEGVRTLPVLTLKI